MKVLLIDDHPIFCLGFEQAMRLADSRIETLVAPTLRDATHLIQEHADLDVVLVEHRLAVAYLPRAPRKVASLCPGVPCVMLAAEASLGKVQFAQSLGARGFLSKTLPAQVVAQALQHVIAGSPVQFDRSGLDPSSVLSDIPTRRQLEVLSLLGNGSSNKIIARHLGISERTVKLHVSALLSTLGARNRTQLLVLAREVGLV